ncbi:uncharacterized protein N7503_000175 [Penicillium pulvis]|uniref:uncharacterized protein n=1 Tax=Penicillium pulvis TaxID=1562058 RepID=UPI002548FB04|nr:uncharacterized protein N7503_000175 [Penicillium pulvis]KAJ5813425.1 hypothetical protein N7503_000175 [Penicillium pulvis]
MTTINNSGTNDGVLVGINNGTVTTQIHLPQRPETPPSPLSTVPFKRDADFVSRDQLLGQIHEKGLIPGSRIALVGLGGVGKSQLAIEYSYRVRSESPETWVFWVHASNAARFEQSFRDIAEQVKIPNRQDLKIDIFRLVENWLRNEKRGKWILILDNVDDDDHFHMHPPIGNAATKPLLQYLPTSLPGYIIVTSRSEKVALKIVEYRDLVEIQPMDKSEGLELLLKKLKSDDNEDSQKLVEELEFMPLAIIQAAGYIRSRAPRYSVARYLAEFRKSDREATNLLKQEANTLYRDWEASNSVLVTWQMSFDCIRRKNPSAADLLSLMCFFDRHGIPDYLLRVQDKSNHDSRKELINDSDNDGDTSESVVDDFEDDIATLRDYSFISIVEDGTIFTMHRLVQMTTRIWLKIHGNIQLFSERSVNILCNEFPICEDEDWEKCRFLFPHVKLATSQRPELLSLYHRKVWATLLYNGTWYAYETGNIADMLEMATKSRKERLKLLGVENEDSLKSAAMLAVAYGRSGQWKRGEKLHMQVMELRKTTLGEDHPSTITSMCELAATIWQQGRYKEAERLEVQVMNIRKKKLGETHPHTLTSMGNLALTFASQGRYGEAESLQIQAVELKKTKLGEDHPETLRDMGNLALTIWKQGRDEEAEKLQIQVMGKSRMKLGEDHPDTLKSMGNLALTFWQQGRYEEAEKLQIQVEELSKTKLGEDHPETLTHMSNLAMTHWKQGRYEEAEKLQVQVLEISKTKLDEDHPDTVSYMGNLASTFWQQGRLEEAEKLQVQVLKISKTKLGEDHPDTLSYMGNLAMMFSQQGRYEEAEKLQVQVIAIRKMKLGSDHPDTLSCIGNLAWTIFKQGRYKEAERLHVQVMETSKTKFAEDHPDTLQIMSNLACAWRLLGRFSDAVDLLQDCLARRERVLGINHPHTLATSKVLLQWTSEKVNDI